MCILLLLLFYISLSSLNGGILKHYTGRGGMGWDGMGGGGRERWMKGGGWLVCVVVFIMRERIKQNHAKISIHEVP